jgi:protocatechuate 3,4-dioxygenase, alpha subunit
MAKISSSKNVSPNSVKLKQTASQTVGPYFAYGLVPSQYGFDYPSLFGAELVSAATAGEHITITGCVFDGAGKPIMDALLEISQADAKGKFVNTRAQKIKTGFSGFGRCGTGTLAGNHYMFKTIKPGAIGAGQAPFVDLIVTMRGLLNHLFTRIYFSDEATANATDKVLLSVPAERRASLIAKRAEADGQVQYRFDIHMQGDDETVFFDA